MSAFDELMAEAQAGKEDPFTSLMAEATTPPPPARTEKPSFGEEVSDVSRRFNKGLTSGMEFITDVGALPITLSERIREGTNKAGREGGYLIDRLKNFGQGFMQPTEFGKRIASNYESPKRLWEDQIGEGEGSALLDPLKTGAELTGEALMTAPFGGSGQGGKLAYKTTPLIASGGAAGEVVGGDTGELLGVMTGAFSGDFPAMAKLLAKTGGTLKRLPRALKRSVKSGDTVANASDAEIRQGLEEIIRNTWSGDPDQIVSHIDELERTVKRKLAAGEKGTLGQLTDDAGILSFEKKYAHDNRRAELMNTNRELEQGVYDATGAIEGEAAQAARVPAKVVQDEIQGIQDVSQGALTKATTAAKRAKARSAKSRPPSEVSSELKQATQKIKDARFEEAKQAFADIPNQGGQIQAKDVTNAAKKFMDDMDDPNLSGQFKRAFPDTMAEINRLEGDVSLEALNGVISKMSKESMDAGMKPEMVDNFKESLYGVLDQIEGASDARKAAAKLYRDYQTDFGVKSQTGRALKQAGEAYAESVTKTKGRGAGTRAEQSRVTGGATEELSDEYLRARFKAEKIDDMTGESRDAAVKSFITQYKEQMSPEQLKEFTKIRKTGKALEAAETGVKEADKQVTALDKSIAGSFAKTGDTQREIVKAAERAMAPAKGKDVTNSLSELLETVSANPKAKQHIQRAFMDEFEGAITSKGGKFKLDGDSLKEFKARRKTYEDSGLYTPEQMQTIEDSLVEGQKIYMHEYGPALAHLPDPEKRVAEVVAALAGAKVGAMAFGSPLIGAALGRRYATKQLRAMGTDKARKIAFELTMNPQKFEDVITRLNKPNLSDKEIQTGLAELFKRATVGMRTEAIGED